ncbi:MAG: 1-(5-phosphoribosyl)-5-[(5-phosphoribosylamino)methylideneamino]imidazole-4-carboxamide isomerase [Planctomycetales bacterium 4484_123]|nr:MAG: 1-(5-phosphoribosyl)-5-[(5-phosphoribosylamino)methylideneamino]imidazole-4-carboxamide isomerase [Planctomycetales bacterium 4484_123]
MDIIPAIDLRGGKVVRLSQGDYNQQRVYADDPAAVARQLESAGACWIHVVDLDAALTGRRTNAEAIAGLCRAVSAKVQLGGGVRDDRAVEAALALGVARVVIGSAALKDWAWFEALAGRAELAGKVVLGLDARDRRLAVHGWTEQTDLTVAEVARRARPLPLAAIVCTDIARDGMMTGPNVELAAEVMKLSGLPVIASGGLRDLSDVACCKQAGCAGVIIGRAWYEGRIDLAAALALGRS